MRATAAMGARLSAKKAKANLRARNTCVRASGHGEEGGGRQRDSAGGRGGEERRKRRRRGGGGKRVGWCSRPSRERRKRE
eukprot:3445434-Rhodomonas_salina.1